MGPLTISFTWYRSLTSLRFLRGARDCARNRHPGPSEGARASKGADPCLSSHPHRFAGRRRPAGGGFLLDRPGCAATSRRPGGHPHLSETRASNAFDRRRRPGACCSRRPRCAGRRPAPAGHLCLHRALGSYIVGSGEVRCDRPGPAPIRATSEAVLADAVRRSLPHVGPLAPIAILPRSAAALATRPSARVIRSGPGSTA